jgi:hypothetical protein
MEATTARAAPSSKELQLQQQHTFAHKTNSTKSTTDMQL